VTFSDLPRSGRRHQGPPLAETLQVYIEEGHDPVATQGTTPYPVKVHQRAALRALEAGGWAKAVEVVPSAAEADLVMRVERTTAAYGVGGPITLLTFGIVPTSRNWTLKVSLVRMSSDGMPRRCVRLQRYKQWIQILLLPFMVGYATEPYEREAAFRLAASCAAEIFGDVGPDAPRSDQG
jgi:hypothetical protein